MPRRTGLLLLAAALAAGTAACGVEEPQAGLRPGSGLAEAEPAPEVPATAAPSSTLPAPPPEPTPTTVPALPASDGYLVAAGAFAVDGVAHQLAEAPGGGLAGSLTPAVVPDGATGAYFYTTWADSRIDQLDELEPGEPAGVPVVRRYDPATGADDEFRAGAYAPAVSTTGVVAWAEDLDGRYLAHASNPTRIVVAAPGGDEPWSEGADRLLIPLGWAGDVLVTYEQQAGASARIVAFDGPGQERVLAERGDVIAFSPDGESILLAEYPVAGTSFVLVRVGDGARLATASAEVRAFHGGHWQGDTVVAPTTTGLLTLGVAGGGLQVGEPVTMSLADFVGVQRPRIDAATGEVRALVTVAPGEVFSYVAVTCSLGGAPGCSPASELLDPMTTRTIGNPSGGTR